MNHRDFYKTQHLNLAAFLMAKGHHLRTAIREESVLFFLFDNSDDISVDVDAHFSNESIPCLDYCDALKRLKTMVYQFGR